MPLNAEFFEGRGLEEDVIKAIMEEHQKDVGEFDKAKTERDDYKTKLETAQESIKNLEGKDVEGMEKELEEYKDKLQKLEEDVAKREYERSITDFVGGYEFTSELAKEAAIAKLTAKELKMEDGKLLGADDLMKEIQKNNPGAFVVDNGGKPLPKFEDRTDPGGGGTPTVYTKEAIEKMSAEEINTHWEDIQKSLGGIK